MTLARVPREVSPDGRLRVRVGIMLAATGGAIVLMLGSTYRLLPQELFIEAALASIWVGIASLFSP
jgi:thiamine transporter ThiT